MLRRIKNKNSKFQKSLILRTIARIIIFPSYIKRFGNFKKFYKYLHMSEREYHTNNEIKKWLPNADIYCFDNGSIHLCEYEETESYQVTEMFINNRHTLLNRLLAD